MKGLFFKIILMFFFGRIKRLCRKYFRHDWFAKLATCCYFLFRFFRSFFLLFIMIKNSRLIGFSPVIKLAAGVCWINLLPKGIYKLLIRHDVWIESNFNCL